MNQQIINEALMYVKDEKARQENYFSENAGVIGTINFITEKMESKLCLNAENGNCPYWWKHDDCLLIMEFLYEITDNKKYLHFQKNAIDFESE